MIKSFKLVTAPSTRLHAWLMVAVAIECVLIALRSVTPDMGLLIMLGALTLPGIIIMLLLRLTKLPQLEFALYSTALSVLYIMLAGLSANLVLPILGIMKPLSLSAFGPWFCALLISLLTALIIRNRSMQYLTALPRFSKQSAAIFGALALLPVISALGAASLNNGGGNIFTMTMFALIGATATGLVIMQNRLASWIWPWAIFTMSLAILWSNSLRGLYITGHDVQLEYYVFRLTDTAQHWSITSFRDAYNACLSITVLPTVLKSITGIDAIEQFKVIYQIIFAIFATGVFAISRRYASAAVSFIAAFIFISFPTFLVDMPMLVRQEIAFGYYIVLLLVLFDRNIKIWQRRTLFSLFALGLVFSHYSTTFVTVAILGGTYALMTPWALKAWRNTSSTNRPRLRSLSIGAVTTVIIVGIAWTGLYTKTGNNITSQLAKIEQQLPSLLSNRLGSETANYSVLKQAKPDHQKLLNQYSAEQRTAAVSALGEQKLYADTANYPLRAVTEPKLALTKFGNWLNRHGISAKTINAAAKSSYALGIQGLVILAIGVTFLYRKRLHIEPEFIALAPVGVALLAMQAIMPVIEYGLFRMLLQDLVFLALPVTLAALQILAWMRIKSARIRTSIVAGTFSLAFLFLTGFIPQLLGGAVGQLALNNSGFYYDAYYTTRSDTAMFAWLKTNYQRGYPINSDTFLRMKIMANTSITTVDGLTPGSIQRESFVVLANQNVTDYRVSFYYTAAAGELVFYRTPTNFLDDHKNLVYSSGDTKVYR